MISHRSLINDFKPHLLIPKGLGQTLAAGLFRKRVRLPDTKEMELCLPDSDKLIILINSRSVNSDLKGSVLLIHGLGSSAHDPHIIQATQELTKCGYNVYRLNHRGVANGAGKAKQAYHAGRDSDVGAAVELVSRLTGDKDFYVVSYSLSSNMLLKYLGQQKPRIENLKGAICICPVWDLASSSEAISKSHFGLLNSIFLRSIQNYFRKISQAASDFKMPDFHRIKTLQDLDRLFTAELAGYKSAEEYYMSSSAGPWIDSIEVPTLLVMTKDDPIATVEYKFPIENQRISKIVFPVGGHLGFVAREGKSMKASLWLDKKLPQLIQEIGKSV